MSHVEADPGRVHDYHVHICYGSEAELTREGLARRFTARLGRWHDQPVGPHSRGMHQVLLTAEQFGRIVPWLMLNRRGLDVLIHPEAGDDLADHTRHALRLGQSLPPRLEALQDH